MWKLTQKTPSKYGESTTKYFIQWSDLISYLDTLYNSIDYTFTIKYIS